MVPRADPGDLRKITIANDRPNIIGLPFSVILVAIFNC